ncbi:MAG TPA: hypothetical protein VGG50_20260 [Streptosporangiaceae bacterium]
MPFALGVTMALVVVVAALMGAGVWAATRLEGHMDTPATLARQPLRHHSSGPSAAHRTGAGHACSGQLSTGEPWADHLSPGQLSRARNVRCRCRDTAHHRAGVR